MKSNFTLDHILNHRSIRKWKDQALEQEVLDTLIAAAQRTSTYMGMQLSSVIRVVDPEKRAKIADVCTQGYVKEAPEFWVYLADNHRNHKIVQEARSESDFTNDSDRFISSYIEASIMAQNVANAAESMGLGIVYFGSVTNDIRKIIEILELPSHVMPVVGMGIGYPDQEPELKPRMDMKHRVFVDKYEISQNYHEDLKEYDREMAKYYDLRNTSRPLDEFTKQVVAKHSQTSEKRNELIEIAKEQGYKI